MVTVGTRRFNIEEWQLDYIKEHYQDKIADIAKATGIKHGQKVCEVIKHLDVKRVRYFKTYLPRTPEVDAELMNPYLSHVELGLKYGVTDSCVALRRKELGVGVRRKNYDTIPELAVEAILNELDLAYLTQKRLEKWSIDFYLGRKYCIDVHGEWAHSKSKVEERDVRKVQFMIDNNYKYLVIHEAELEDIEAVKNKIIDFVALGFPSQ